MMLDTRSSPDAGGFQSLFANATQHTPGSDAPPTTPSLAQKCSGSAGPAGVSNRRQAAARSSGDLSDRGSALAGLAIPPPAAIPLQASVPSNGKTDEVALVGTAGSTSSQAGPSAAANFHLDTRATGRGRVSKAGDDGPLGDTQGHPANRHGRLGRVGLEKLRRDENYRVAVTWWSRPCAENTSCRQPGCRRSASRHATREQGCSSQVAQPQTELSRSGRRRAREGSGCGVWKQRDSHI